MKAMLTLLSIIILYFIIGSFVSENVKIPKESIRFRVLANSNSESDQNIKKKVAITMQKELESLLKNETSIEKSRGIIKKNLNLLDAKIENIFIKENYTLPYNINLGYNYFPKKSYNNIMYEEGYYESLLVTIGSGKGDNWWCVLFPSLCILEVEENQNVEYTTLVKEIINKHI